MENKLKKAFVIAKINFSNIKAVYIIVSVLLLVGIYNIVASSIGLSDNHYFDIGNYFYVIAILAPIFIPANHLSRIVHLGGKKIDFYWGCLLNYVIIAASISIINVMLFLISKAVMGSQLEIINIVNVFGWYENGAVATFFQQFAFILLVEIFINTMINMQVFWYGWVTDVLLIVILSVFIPVKMLRVYLEGFFNLIIFNNNAFLQIISCLILSSGIYALNLLVLKQRKV